MKFEKFLEDKGYNRAKFQELDAEEQMKLHAEYVEAVAKSTENKLDKEGLAEELKAYFGEDTTPEEFKTRLEGFEQKLQDLEDLQNKGGGPEGLQSIFDAVKRKLEENKEAVVEVKNNEHKSLKIPLGRTVAKAVQAMTFATNTTGRVGRVEREAGVVGILRRRVRLMDLIDLGGTTANTYVWIQKEGVEGGVAMTPEGTTKPQGDFNLVEYTQKPKKEAIIITVSKEMLDDIDDLANTVNMEARELLELFMEDQILNGDGTGENITGIDANATAFAAGAFANAIEGANIFDVIRVAYNQVNLNEDDPTAILMHPTDATEIDLQKATDGQYVLPPFSSADGTVIKGLPVVTSTLVTQGELYVGNFRRYKARIRENIVLDMGYRGAAGDWEKNFISFRGEARFFGFIPTNHYGSIVKAVIATAKAALETP